MNRSFDDLGQSLQVVAVAIITVLRNASIGANTDTVSVLRALAVFAELSDASDLDMLSYDGQRKAHQIITGCIASGVSGCADTALVLRTIADEMEAELMLRALGQTKMTEN